MNTNSSYKVHNGVLRRHAEGRLKERKSSVSADEKTVEWDTKKLLYELDVYRIELEMQNEELSRTRTEVEEGLTRYTDLYEFAPVGYLTLDREGTILQMNLTGALFLKMERSRLLGKRLGSMITRWCNAAFNDFLSRIFTSGIKQTCEVMLSQEGVEPLTVELTGTAMDKEQECRITMTDITFRKQADIEQEELRSQLLQSQKLEAVGAFANVIAHDFNNILGGILGTLTLLDLNGNYDSKHHSYIMKMQSLVEHGADLTKQLLGISVSRKRKAEALDVSCVLEEMIDGFGLKHSDIAIERRFSEDLRAVFMDKSELELMMMHLLGNAAQAMPDGGCLLLAAENTEISPTEAALRKAATGSYVKLIVSDTGIGMDAATKARIFEPFFTTKNKGQRKGLGLVSVFNIIRNHSGFITVESKPGLGATFKIFLPSVEKPIEYKKAPIRSANAIRGTVLVIDDEEQILTTNAVMLKKIGYNVLTASNGARAVEIVRQYKGEISLVILDLVMPDMGGRETYLELREIIPDIRVLLSSGYCAEGEVQELLALGCSGFIAKPFRLAELSQKVSEILL